MLVHLYQSIWHHITPAWQSSQAPPWVPQALQEYQWRRFNFHWSVLVWGCELCFFFRGVITLYFDDRYMQ